MTRPSTEPKWPHCGRDATAQDRVGCRGRRVLSHLRCLAHLAERHRADYLRSLAPGADIDHRGTTFTQPLLKALLDALHDPTTGNAHFGLAKFSEAQFCGDVSFKGAQFRDAWFGGAQFSGKASFYKAQFAVMAWFGPVVCEGTVDLSGAVFEAPVTLEIAAPEVRFWRTRWEATSTVRLRYAATDLSDAVLTFPVAVTSHPARFRIREGAEVEDRHLLGNATKVQVKSVRGVDAAHLVLADLDLTDCVFSGAFHLDQLRLEGRCTFASVPPGWHWRHWHPVRFTPRRTLAEEHHWRATQPTALSGWKAATEPGPVEPAATEPGPVEPAATEPGPEPAAEPGPEPAAEPGPEPAQLAAVYRALRKAFEDSKNEPGAADFYYGEMEMRRHDRTRTSPVEHRTDTTPVEHRTDTTPVEHVLLHGYWMLSGYGLSAFRALGWLAAAMLVTIVLLMGLGLPQDSPKQEATGTVDGGKVTFKIDKSVLQNPTEDQFTCKRFEKALNVTLNSVVFRSSGQDLTTAGTYIEMASRVTEPILLGLAVLAVRSRVKR
ncbi:pentapeptide repeat-containing protein [Streptomyces sp. NPDC000229]|uniref:pentapeptide repeat-containing protein n=1 Tax=Streptomyces sp. NPDC000229 TaxID=3154247 RepID=UPI00332207ED